MVGYYNAYKGSTHTPVIYAGNKIVKKVYKGSELIYQIGFYPFTVGAGASLQAWTVPPGVTKIHVDCVASKGNNGRATGGNGGRVQCDINVTGGQTLYITVGAIPYSNTNSYNASDIRIGGTEYGNRIVVSGGGGCGSTGGENNSNGGNGGGLVGVQGNGSRYATGGGGGTQSSGGAGGSGNGSYNGNAGNFGVGGQNNGHNSGAGGAGWYGGGSGGTEGHNGHYYHAGGGGGSSYTNGTYCSNVIHTQGYMNGSGYVTISFVDTLGG